jgi:predicted O-methyltransferase YrrM
MLPPGWLSDAEAAYLAKIAKRKTVLELGAWLGRSTVVLASTAKHVVSVDWHKGDEDAGFGDTLPGYWDTVRNLDAVTMVVGRFEFVVPLFAPVFELAFVDGSHAADAVERDARLALSVTRGTVVFHDYDQPAVQAAVAAVFGPPVRRVDTLAICEMPE